MFVGDSKIREKYPLAAAFLDSTIEIICEAFDLRPSGPTHDVSEWILVNFFVEGKEDSKT